MRRRSEAHGEGSCVMRPQPGRSCYFFVGLGHSTDGSDLMKAAMAARSSRAMSAMEDTAVEDTVETSPHPDPLSASGEREPAPAPAPALSLAAIWRCRMKRWILPVGVNGSSSSTSRRSGNL
jgi:hypothetical protein